MKRKPVEIPVVDELKGFSNEELKAFEELIDHPGYFALSKYLNNRTERLKKEALYTYYAKGESLDSLAYQHGFRHGQLAVISLVTDQDLKNKLLDYKNAQKNKAVQEGEEKGE